MSLIGKFAHLPGRPRSSEAMPMLEKIASLVKPIMKKRGWKVGVLGEFFPANPALLGININGGQRINLRLRPPDNPDGFYELEQLVLVMLHELTHIVHGPHDTSFYKLLAELEEEYYDLKRKGYSGEGFHSDGNRLHGTRLNEYEGRKRGLAAAEKRMKQQLIMGRGGVLGGSKVAGKSMREIIAEAAERRLKDDKTCKVDNKEAEEESRKAQEESVVVDATEIPDPPEVVDLTGDSDSGGESSSKANSATPSGSGGTTSSTSATPGPKRPRPSWVTDSSPSASSSTSRPPSAPAAATRPSASSTSRPAVNGPKLSQPNNASAGRPSAPVKAASSQPPAPKLPSATDEWACGICTLLNPMSAPRCDACQAPRPVQRTAEGWFCEICGAGPREMDFWSCLECGTVRKWG